MYECVCVHNIFPVMINTWKKIKKDKDCVVREDFPERRRPKELGREPHGDWEKHIPGRGGGLSRAHPEVGVILVCAKNRKGLCGWSW